jgi:hypothetical protein
MITRAAPKSREIHVSKASIGNNGAEAHSPHLPLNFLVIS